MLSKRFFTVQGIQHMESLTLSFADIDMMKKDFKGHSRTFFKVQIQQAFTVLTNLEQMIQNFGSKQKDKLMDYNDLRNRQGQMLKKNLRSVKKYMAKN